MAIYQLAEHTPRIDPSTYVSDEATVIGKVVVAPHASIWSGAILRGDNETITVGAGSNVQEGCVLHSDPGYPLCIGARVTVGHQAMLHGCMLGEGTLVGMQAVILNGARIGRNCLVGAGALITENKQFPDNSLIVGVPAKVLRTLGEADIAAMHVNTASYVERAQYFKQHLKKIA